MRRRPIRALRLWGTDFVMVWHSGTNVAFLHTVLTGLSGYAHHPWLVPDPDSQPWQVPGRAGAKTDGQARAACGGRRWRSCPRPPRPAKPTDKPIRHATGRPKGAWAPVLRPGALCGAFDDRGQDPKAGTAHARQRLPACQRAPDGRGQRRQSDAGGPNGPAGLRFGQRQRRAGNPVFCPVDFNIKCVHAADFCLSIR